MGNNSSRNNSSSSSSSLKSPRNSCENCGASKVNAKLTRQKSDGAKVLWLCSNCVKKMALQFDKRGTISFPESPIADADDPTNVPNATLSIWSVAVGVGCSIPSQERLLDEAEKKVKSESVFGMDFLSFSSDECAALSDAVKPNSGGRQSVALSSKRADLHQLFSGGVLDSAEAVSRFCESVGQAPENQSFKHVLVIEPCKSVGTNHEGLPVRASKNLAFIVKQLVPSWEPVLVECFKTGAAVGQLSEHTSLALSRSRFYCVEGGSMAIYDEASFKEFGGVLTRSDWINFVAQLLLNRSTLGSPLGLFICIGHQTAFVAMVELVRQSCSDIRRFYEHQTDDEKKSGLKFAQLAEAALSCVESVETIGKRLHVRRNGQIVAKDWTDLQFAVTKNEAQELGARRLCPYREGSSLPSGAPDEKCTLAPEDVRTLMDAHRDTVARFHVSMRQILKTAEDLSADDADTITMFHSDEVTEEAALFVNYAFSLLATARKRGCFDFPELSHLKRLPQGVSILASTEHLSRPGVPLTEVAAAVIHYAHGVRNFTTQFHLELQEDLQEYIAEKAKEFEESHHLMDGFHVLANMLLSAANEERRTAKHFNRKHV